MKIELLYLTDCPSYQGARIAVEQVLVEEGIAAPMEMVCVMDEDDATMKQFVGSPTLRVNGADLFPDQMSGVYSMQCRVYHTPQGFKGIPTKEVLRAALRRSFDL